MLAHLILERLSWSVLPRIPEPVQVMTDSTQNSAFAEAGREDGILAFLYLYHALQITPLVRDGDRVLDLACGPANQLVQIARLNPHSQFLGLDASENMLDRARKTVDAGGVGNVELLPGDMTQLSGIDNASVDSVICTMSLHHLADMNSLVAAMGEAKRVLKPGGGFYFVDFGRLKRTATQRFFADDQRNSQSEQFTRDYLDSMRAAFSLAELREAAAPLHPVLHATPLAPFMVVLKSASRRKPPAEASRLASGLYSALPVEQKKNFQAFARWFSAGGFPLPFELH